MCLSYIAVKMIVVVEVVVVSWCISVRDVVHCE